MIPSANETSGDAPPAAMDQDKIREQIRQHMERKNQAIFNDMLRERSSTQVPRQDPPPVDAPPKDLHPKRTRRPNLHRKDFDRILDMLAQGFLNYQIADKLGINKNAVGRARTGDYRGMSGQQIRRAKRIERDRENKAESAGCRPTDLPPNLGPAQMKEYDAHQAKTLHTLYEGHPLAGKSENAKLTDDKPQLSAASKAQADAASKVQQVRDGMADRLARHEPAAPEAPRALQARRENGVGAVLELLDRQQRQQADVISDLVAQVRSLLK